MASTSEFSPGFRCNLVYDYIKWLDERVLKELNIQKDDIEMILDRILALIMLILLSPLFVIISIALAITSGFPIIYKHKRCGYNFFEFDMYKFRTMKINKGLEII